MKKQNRIAILNISSTVLLRSISLVTSYLFAWLLGTDGTGVTAAYTTWVSIAAIVCTLQTNGSLVNARIEYPEADQSRYQSSVMTLSLLFFLVCCGLTAIFIRPVMSLLQMSAVMVALMLWQAFGTFCINFLNSKFTYEFKAGRNMILSVVTALSTLLLSVALILLMPEDRRAFGRILGMAVTYGTLGVAACIYVLGKGKTFFQPKYWKFCLTLAIPVMFYNLSDLLLGHSDLVMVRHMAGDSAAGIYGVAFNFGNVMFTIFAALNNSWTPFFFDDMKQNRDVKSQAKNFLELFTVLSMGFVLLTREVFHLYERDFWDGTVLVPIFVASYYLNFLCTFPVNFEYFHKKTKVVAAATVASSLVNIALNYFFILRFGIIGAAAATLLSHCLQYSAHYLYCRYVLGKGSYPFGVRLWAPYAAIFVLTAAFSVLASDLWLLRWGLGAGLGAWELLRIRKRKVLL